MREPAHDAEVNFIGWLRVLENSARLGVKRICFASSGGVLYGNVSTPATEDWQAQPISPYGIAKWAGEQYLQFFAREHGMQTVALRYANVYGPRQNPHGEAGVVEIFSKKLLAGEPAVINGDGRYVRDYVYVKDVARANILAMELTNETDFVPLNIGTGIATDVNALANLVRAQVQSIWNSTGRDEVVPPCLHGEARQGDLRTNLICADQARFTLGWKPEVQLSDGLQDTVAWFSQPRA